MNNLQAAWIILKREYIVNVRRRQEWATPWLFFILITVLFPLAINPEPQLLRSISAGIIWIGLLLAVLLSLSHLFSHDYLDGTLEQLLLSPYPLSLLMLAKITAHWLTTTVPIILLAPLLAYMLHLPSAAMGTFIVSLLLGAPLLNLLGAISAALTMSLRHNGLLLTLLLLPLYIPILIFATLAINNAAHHLPSTAPLALLAAMLLVACVLAPLAVAQAIKIGLCYDH